MTGCTGPCDQGRKLCPTPHACGLASPPDEDAPQQDIVRVVLTDIALSAVLIAVIALSAVLIAVVAAIVLWVAR